jgi:phosphate-selective porin OprO and OprP
MRTLPLALAVLTVTAVPLRAQAPLPSSKDAPGEPPASGPTETPVDAPTRPQVEEPKDAPAPPAGEKNPPVSVSGEGFFLQSESGDFKLQIRGYVQFDGRFYPGGDGALGIDTFVVRRARPILQGTVAKYFDFVLMPDFGSGAAVIQDAYLDVHYSAKARIRAGKFKPPVGIEQLQPETASAFVERAFPSALVPNRDIGVGLHGELADGIVAYAAGVFDGAPDGGSLDTDLNDGKDVDARIFISPFKRGHSLLKDLGFGISGTRGDQAGPLPAYRTNGQISIITILAGITYDGIRKRYSPQLSLYSGPFGLLAEYVDSDSKVKKADGTHATFEAKAWQATATVALTRDKASYTGLRPRNAFDPGKGQWGALELAARVNGIELGAEATSAGIVDPTKSVRKAFAWAVGVNWHLNRNLKQVLDYERTTFTGGAAAGQNRLPDNAILMRTQVAF